MDMKDENKEKVDIELITAYAQMAFFTLQNSGTEITPKAIKSEIKMFYGKFGNSASTDGSRDGNCLCYPPHCDLFRKVTYLVG